MGNLFLLLPFIWVEVGSIVLHMQKDFWQRQSQIAVPGCHRHLPDLAISFSAATLDTNKFQLILPARFWMSGHVRPAAASCVLERLMSFWNLWFMTMAVRTHGSPYPFNSLVLLILTIWHVSILKGEAASILVNQTPCYRHNYKSLWELLDP